ncbi:MAG: dipeptidyl aminopeptidase/acylaminoacyl peptidase [Colwellia sp.]|jgi:dipeptidyl aminopeptidase/acylaminoacyl peptidase
MSTTLFRTYKNTLKSTFFIFVGLLSLSSKANDFADVEHQTVTIWSQGTRLAGDIYKPKGLKATDKLPGILMVPGWGGSKNNIGEKYAPYFAQKGFIVLTFDFISWGESDGHLLATKPLVPTKDTQEILLKTSHVRDIINPFVMTENVRSALHYLGGEPQVTTNNLGIWGTSMGGGLALVVAANDDRVKALVTQMSPVNYTYNLRAFPDNKIRQIETLTARGILPPFPGPKSKINPLLAGYPDWVAMKRFEPLAYADKLTAATLIIDAQEESLFDISQNGQLLHERIKTRVDSRYMTYPGKHYDLYKGESLNAARTSALQWFINHLNKP